MRRVLAGLALVYGPLVWLWLTVPVVSVDQAEPADAALIFGALVRSEQISPLHAERLDTGVALWDASKVDQLVMSNAARAAEIMASYVARQGVPSAAIALDPAAQSTPDTCLNETQRLQPRSLLLVSQRYHLPRIALQCRRLGVEGQYVAALRSQEAAEATGVWTKLRVRVRRNTREALLVWAEWLGLYRKLERVLSH
ncbi:MAG: YdcF family protein [Pseudomonadota bacterium]